jgi:hypothetical protein
MNRSVARITVSLVAVAILGCATRPENVTAQYVSSGRYDGYDCKRLVREADEVDTRVRSLTGTLQSKANTDAALVGVGMILFWPALLALPATGGKAEEQELGKLKGEAQAIQRAYKEKDCDSAGSAKAGPGAAPAAQPAQATAIPQPASAQAADLGIAQKAQ